jgi:hypothetical protein
VITCNQDRRSLDIDPNRVFSDRYLYYQPVRSIKAAVFFLYGVYVILQEIYISIDQKLSSPIYLSIYLSIYLPTALQSLSYTQSVELLGRGISPSQGRYLHTGQHKRTQTSMA